MFLPSRNLYLRPIADTDVRGLHALVTRHPPDQFLGQHRTMISLRDFALFIKIQSLSRPLMAIVNADRSALCGYAVVQDMSPWDDRASMMLFLEPGAAHLRAEAHATLNEYLFKWYPVRQIETRAESQQGDEIRILEMVGYEYTGLEPSRVWYKGQYLDFVSLVLTRESWERNRHLVSMAVELESTRRGLSIKPEH